MGLELGWGEFIVIFQMSRSKSKQPTVHDPKDNLKIFLRVKPILIAPAPLQSLKVTSSSEVEVTPPYSSPEGERVFSYEEVFPPTSTNQLIFSKTMQEPIANVLAGHNSTVFIYGMTGAGKTHTMFHAIAAEAGEAGEDEGLVGLALRKLCRQVQGESGCQLLISFCEVYNEHIRDLLAEGSHSLTLLEDPQRGVVVDQLTELHLGTESQGRAAIREGLQRRAHNATRSNEMSSRSHAILQLTVRRQRGAGVFQSRLFLVDLAGNERASAGEGKRFAEGVNINKSLLTLGKCISLLAEQKKPGFIPFRDSKLTRLLKDALGGNARTVMIACVSSQARFYEQTLNTLKYSAKAKRIKNHSTGGHFRLLAPHQHHHHPSPTPAPTVCKVEGWIKKALAAAKEIAKIESLLQQLRQSYQDCEEQLEKGQNEEDNLQSLSDISQIMPKLMGKQANLQQQLDETGRHLAAHIEEKESAHQSKLNALQKKVELQTEQIRHLEKERDLDKNKCRSKEKQAHLQFDASSIRQSIDKLSKEQKDKKEEKKQTKSCSFILIHQGKSDIKNKDALSSCKNKQNIPPNFKRPNTPQTATLKATPTSLKSSTAQLPTRKPKPTIDISVEHIRIRPPQESSATSSSRQEWSGRLKEMQRRGDSKKQAVQSLVGQLEKGKWQINVGERSMLNKLRFLSKEKEKEKWLAR